MARDENYAKTLAQLENFEHHEFSLGSDIMKYLPKMVYHLDEPIGDPAAILTYLMCYNAERRGSKVILSGMGADEIFSGIEDIKPLCWLNDLILCLSLLYISFSDL